jgi:L-lactate utilization protein LutB
VASRERGKKLYDLLLELDQLEDLREELDERGLRSIEEIEQRIEEISAQVEALEGQDADEK